MIRSQLKELLDRCFQEGVDNGSWSDRGAGKYTVELPKHEGQGDFSTNIALVLAGIEKRNPRELAGIVAEKLGLETAIVAGVEIAGPGFVNITIQPAVWHGVLAEVFSAGENFGRSQVGAGRKVMVEFVSANPTGPLSIGHGRQAILGDSIARLLEATNHDVFREYYYNNAGRQMRVLGESTRARYLELIGAEFSFPEDGYQGEYIIDIAQSLVDEHGEKLKDEPDVEPFKDQAEKAIFKDISGTLERMGIHFDNYYNERSLYENGHIDSVVQELRDKGLVYEKDDAVWFETTKLGQEKDRVIIKSTGEPTYRLPDIAYHREKFKRNFDWLIDIFGSDHIATVPDVLSGVEALGYDASKVTVLLHQFVTLTRDGKQVKMSTRKANFVTVDELIDVVGEDVLRFFYMLRKADSQLEFDLDLATSQSQDNPVYYVQYAHARLCSILAQSGERGIVPAEVGSSLLQRLQEPEELALLKTLSGFPAAIEGSALDLAPHKFIHYLMEFAGQFHSYYNKHKVITEDLELSQARLCLIQALQLTLQNGLHIIGLTAPKSM
ncbi:arginine--tRNA ligase [Desulfotalea psychrophila]|uniref:Arginine--tRNA ligase n=1 Tax=Desulfotalea psychrophila (strain LSv54 / DSM 12343) TaxID=177439 RepID=SYR_DESPS|nr:arginine--tRNA ligase [Desulfotalea psychrophila]Q6AJJ9.1 RecName: Full=Arginine--tRNA ligase; AltName: Full=Arginyl-tRNA synthetase; Short=ArgRS [Desulfotalea psychrophila LSv54]CAG37481.1 probable arginyl-tRNA synthetase [Desulfotalea psychrophila LSv54]